MCGRRILVEGRSQSPGTRFLLVVSMGTARPGSHRNWADMCRTVGDRTYHVAWTLLVCNRAILTPYGTTFSSVALKGESAFARI